ncbi:MAG: hypothetical protein PHF79_02550 [Candidatus Pacebacteria bacterium]|nr:hypothetical protein [Candidatus Paceibacterota bacterium]
MKKVFDTDASEHNFRGYISIFNCNPRFPESKEFQIFYKKDIKDKTEVVFHEILHFIFFDYCTANLPEETSPLDKNTGKLWELSEIINVIILNLPEFKTLIGREERLFYPGLKDMLAIVQIIWNKKTSMQQFIRDGLATL